MIVQVCLTQKRGRLQYGNVRIPYLFLFLNACISYSVLIQGTFLFQLSNGLCFLFTLLGLYDPNN